MAVQVNIAKAEALTKKVYIDNVSNAIQKVLDEEAQSMGYDSIHTAVSYATETAVASFQADGKSFRKWRSNVWKYCYTVLAQYEIDVVADPTLVPPTKDDMIAGIPLRV